MTLLFFLKPIYDTADGGDVDGDTGRRHKKTLSEAFDDARRVKKRKKRQREEREILLALRMLEDEED